MPVDCEYRMLLMEWEGEKVGFRTNQPDLVCIRPFEVAAVCSCFVFCIAAFSYLKIQTIAPGYYPTHY